MCLTCVLLLPIGKRIIFHCVHHRLNHLSTTLLPHVFVSAIYQDIFIYYYKYYFTVECNFFQTDFYYWSKMKFRFDKLYHIHPSNSRCRFRLGCIRHAPPPFLKKLSIFVVKWDNYFSFYRLISRKLTAFFRPMALPWNRWCRTIDSSYTKFVPPVTKFLYPFIQQDQFPIVIQGLTKINISGMVCWWLEEVSLTPFLYWLTKDSTSRWENLNRITNFIYNKKCPWKDLTGTNQPEEIFIPFDKIHFHTGFGYVQSEFIQWFSTKHRDIGSLVSRHHRYQ